MCRKLSRLANRGFVASAQGVFDAQAPPVLPILLLAAYRSGVFRKKSIRASQRGWQKVYPEFLGESEARYANGSLDERGVGVREGEAGVLRGW